tara:strand:- start:2139 stop:3206 length:1068 start_codon:yes stop_codon:yes gene_type:complete
MASTRNFSKIFSIEGNIGSGKSTIIKILKEHFKEDDRIIFLLEPVDEWNTIHDNDNKTILENYYENKNKYAFTFQMMAYISRLSQLKKALNDGYEYIITERSITTDKHVFAKMLYDSGEIEKIEFDIYNKWFEHFIGDIPDINYIYINTTTIIAESRVIQRGRNGENKISFDYLQKCYNYHNNWLSNISNVLEINGNININDEPSYIEQIKDLFIKYTNINSNKFYTLTFDGGSRGNPGPSGCGYVIYNNAKKIVVDGYKYLGIQTNNYAEYMGIICGLEKAIEKNITHLIIKGDSKLVINQLNGTYKIASPNLLPLYNNASDLLSKINKVDLIHIKRNMNAAADKLANIAIDKM